MAVLVAVLAPPPLPTKIFILIAGFVGMPWLRFVAAVFTGRMIRFGGEAYLAVRLGDQALETLQRNYPLIGAGLAGGVAVVLEREVSDLRGPHQTGNERAIDMMLDHALGDERRTIRSRRCTSSTGRRGPLP